MTDPTTKDQGQTCDFEAMRATAPEHAYLEPFIGTFKAKISMFMGPGDPMIATGVMKNEPELGGRFLRHHYTGDPSEGPFSAFHGRGYWGYNTVDKRFESVWIDNACTFMIVDRGHASDNGKTFEMEGHMTDPGSGKPMTRRSVITLIDKDTHLMEMYHHPEGGEECKTMEIRYERT